MFESSLVGQGKRVGREDAGADHRAAHSTARLPLSEGGTMPRGWPVRVTSAAIKIATATASRERSNAYATHGLTGCGRDIAKSTTGNATIISHPTTNHAGIPRAHL